MDKVGGFFCTASVYEYEGVRFELSWPVGPWPVDDVGNPAEDEPGNDFWALVDEFMALSKEEQARHCVVGGGCFEI